jgi:hypothetical protein
MSSRKVTMQQLAAAAKKINANPDTLQMPQSRIRLLWWQVVAAAELCERFNDSSPGRLSGAILAHKVGLSKTYTAMAFMLKVQ